jgi:hypothetical protein
LNNVAFASLHVTVLTVGLWPALRPTRPAEAQATGVASRQEERAAA